MADKVYRDGISIDIIVNMQASVTGASTLSLLVKRPDGITVSWSGTAYNTNYIKHTTVAGDINQAGIYKICPKLVYATGQVIYGETAELPIYDHFD